MSKSEKQFQQFQSTLADGGGDAALKFLADHYRSSEQYPELFEVLKANIRFGMGLPLIPGNDLHQLEEDVQQQLEDQLLEACRETGLAMLDKGNLSQAWMYLQPLPDRQSVKSAFEAVTITPDNSAEYIEIALYAGAAPESGYRLLLDHQGTCNGITFYDTQATYQDKTTQYQLAEILVDHIYTELRKNLAVAINEQEGSLPALDTTLANLISERDWLFTGCGHHLDVTHLASIIRIARNCRSTESLKMAEQLCRYGLRLDPQLHYPGEPPFVNSFVDHHHYYCGRLGQDLDQAVEHFRRMRGQAAGPEEIANIGNVLIELLSNNDRSQDAITELLSLPSEFVDVSELIRLAKKECDYDQIMQHFQDQENLLGYCLTSISKHGA